LVIVLLVAVIVIAFSVLSIDARLKKQNANAERIVERLDMIYNYLKKRDDEHRLQ